MQRALYYLQHVKGAVSSKSDPAHHLQARHPIPSYPMIVSCALCGMLDLAIPHLQSCPGSVENPLYQACQTHCCPVQHVPVPVKHASRGSRPDPPFERVPDLPRVSWKESMLIQSVTVSSYCCSHQLPSMTCGDHARHPFQGIHLRLAGLFSAGSYVPPIGVSRAYGGK